MFSVVRVWIRVGVEGWEGRREGGGEVVWGMLGVGLSFFSLGVRFYCKGNDYVFGIIL